MKEKIIKALKDDYDLFYADLAKLIQIESLSNNKEKVIHALNFVLDLAEDFGLKAESLLDNQVGVIEYGDQDEICGLLTHIDVVEADEENWHTNPFELVEQDGNLIGRGVIDGKGPLLMLLYIMKYMKKFDIKTKHRIQLIIGTQEEVVWSDMQEYIKEFTLPDYGFTPDGLFPIQNAEKGLLDIAFEFDKDNIEEISAGNATNTVPSFFDIVIDEQSYNFYGKSTHSSTPENGENAIVKGCVELSEKYDHFLFKFVKDYFSDYNGKAFDLRQDAVIDEIDNKSTLVPTMIEDTTNELFLSVNVRLAHENTYDKIIGKIEQIKEDYQFEYECFDYIKPIYVDPNTEFVRELTQAYEEETNKPVEYIFANNTSYAKALPNFVCFGPIIDKEKDSSHQANESISIDDFMMAYKIYTNAILKLTKVN